MDGKFFQLGLPEDVAELVADIANGLRLRISNSPKSNPIKRKKRNIQICQQRIENVKTAEIAQTFALSECYIKKILRENGITIAAEKKKSRRELLKEYLGKYNKKTIAEMLGISRVRLYQILKEEGL